MKGKDTIDVKIDFTPKLVSYFRIPFTKFFLILTRVEVGINIIEPLEGQTAGDPVEHQSGAFDNADPQLANAARDQAMVLLGVAMTNVVFSGVGKVNVWIRWLGMTWNAATWSKVLKDIEFYARTKQTRTTVADDEYQQRRRWLDGYRREDAGRAKIELLRLVDAKPSEVEVFSQNGWCQIAYADQNFQDNTWAKVINKAAPYFTPMKQGTIDDR